MNNFDENGRNRYNIIDGVVHMDVYNLCNVKDCDVLFDEQFLDQVISRTWRQVAKPGGVYISSWGRKGEPSKHMSLHRYIMLISGKDISGKEIDHINGNKFDNRLCNLRVVDHKKQMLNLPPSRRNKYGIRGVTDGGLFNQPYRVFFTYDHHTFGFKYFATLPEAVYTRYLMELHYFDDVAIKRHIPAMKPYIDQLTDQQKKEIEQYVGSIIKKHSKELTTI